KSGKERNQDQTARRTLARMAIIIPHEQQVKQGRDHIEANVLTSKQRRPGGEGAEQVGDYRSYHAEQRSEKKAISFHGLLLQVKVPRIERRYGVMGRHIELHWHNGGITVLQGPNVRIFTLVAQF